jgi:hypothetical protein
LTSVFGSESGNPDLLTSVFGSENGNPDLLTSVFGFESGTILLTSFLMSLLSLRLPLLLAQRLLILLLQAPSLKRLWTQIASIVLPSLFLCTPTRSLHQRQHQRHLPVMKPLHSDWATQNGIRGLTICDVAMQQQQQPQQQQQQRRRFPLLPQQQQQQHQQQQLLSNSHSPRFAFQPRPRSGRPINMIRGIIH